MWPYIPNVDLNLWLLKNVNCWTEARPVCSYSYSWSLKLNLNLHLNLNLYFYSCSCTMNLKYLALLWPYSWTYSYWCDCKPATTLRWRLNWTSLARHACCVVQHRQGQILELRLLVKYSRWASLLCCPAPPGPTYWTEILWWSVAVVLACCVVQHHQGWIFDLKLCYILNFFQIPGTLRPTSSLLPVLSGYAINSLLDHDYLISWIGVIFSTWIW